MVTPYPSWCTPLVTRPWYHRGVRGITGGRQSHAPSWDLSRARDVPRVDLSGIRHVAMAAATPTGTLAS
jgi:hypothetical protein